MTIYPALRRLVVSGELDADQRVTESALAARLQVSRTPVREALLRLEGEGLVFARGRGVRVRVLDDDELAELLAARAGLEGWAMYEAASRVGRGEVPPAQVAALHRLATEANALTLAGLLAEAARANRQFHQAAASLAGNTVIDHTLALWWDRITISTRRSIQTPARVTAVDDEHARILAALEAGDAESSRAYAETHALHTRDALVVPAEGGTR